MKAILWCVLAALLALPVLAIAEDDPDPWYGELDARLGFMYDDKQSQWHEYVTIPVLGYKDKLHLEVGLSNSETGFIALTYNLANLKRLGLDMPLAEHLDINIGIWYGAKFLVNDDDRIDAGKADRVGLVLSVVRLNTKD